MNDNAQQPNENVDEIDNLRAKCDEYLNGWKRAKADLVNAQNDFSRERIEWVRYAAARTLERLLPAMDTLYAALEHHPELADTVKKFEDYLKGENVVEVVRDGIYNPEVHEVIGMEEKEGVESGAIIQVAQRGYKLYDKVLRPAKVIIAK